MDIQRIDYFTKTINVLTTYLIYCSYIKICSNRRNRIWVREMFELQEREMYGFYSKIFKIMKENDTYHFRKATRMSIQNFELLFALLKDKLVKHSMRKPVEAECRLLLTLVFLSQGSSWYTLSWAFRLGYCTVRKIILETCEVIWNELFPIYLAEPNELEWEKIAVDNFNSTGLPNCVGAIDGKHIKIQCPPNCGSLYFNYKSFHSIVLLAACDSNYCFTAVNIGAFGSQSDGGVLRTSTFGNKILNGTMNLPKPKNLPNSNVKFPFYFAGDAAFPLRENIMRPYPGKNLSPEKQNFNKKLSSARVKIENTFGIITEKWRVLHTTLNLFPANAEKIVQAVVVLHNFVKMNDGEYCPPGYVDHCDGERIVEGLWRKSTAKLPQSKLFQRFNCTRSAFQNRDILKDFINNK